VKTDEDWRELTLLLFHGKRLFPSPDELRDVGFQGFAEFDLCAGSMLVADGALPHWGVNQAAKTDSLATNFLPESWLVVRSEQARPGAAPQVTKYGALTAPGCLFGSLRSFWCVGWPSSGRQAIGGDEGPG